MLLIAFLILFPLIIAALLLLLRGDGIRNVVVWVSAVAIAVASIMFAVQYLGSPWKGFEFSSVAADYIACAIGVAISCVVLGFGVKYKNSLAIVLAIIQLVGDLIFEFGFAHNVHVAACTSTRCRLSWRSSSAS